ncbi:MAG: family 20 glycosylhydrolase [Lachnospiraceae bacterium]|nr:family 20 glycosylhydrolase [Lachnospiraceae bacterium]
MWNRKKISAILIIVLFIAVGAAIIVAQVPVRNNKSANQNLALMKGVKAVVDSVETDELSADKAIDGDDETLSSRWSSENNWENASHYIELEFPEEISVSFVVLKWERRNVTSYQLESSLDGEEWNVVEKFDHAPELKRQEIALAETETVKFLRLSTNAVSQNEEDYSNLYQNVSLYEFEVYADKPAAYYVDEPVIEVRDDGSRMLKMPEAPDGYKLTFLGADYEQIIGADGEIYDTIQDKDVVVGYLVESVDNREDKDEISFTVHIPAADYAVDSIGKTDIPSGAYNGMQVNGISSNELPVNEIPQVIPSITEWKGSYGECKPDKNSRIIIGDEALMQTANLFAVRYHEIMGYDITVRVGTIDDLKSGDFYLAYDSEGAASGLGEEGYICNINDTCVINGAYEKGIYWGTITILQILKTKDGILPQGIIRDYPKYKVRGFGIDVARKPVSLSMLYQIVENMSWYKMNDLSIHLNDNVILGTSGLTDSFDNALTAYAAFRIDTSVTNAKGDRLTSEDYSYTAEEFANFIADAKTYGICVVPEIDTPAHSLAITGLFPEYALKVSNETADQLDLSKKKARELVKNIWYEALNGVQESGRTVDFNSDDDANNTAAFSGAEAVNIGMDEYYGDGETYRRYMNEIIEFVRGEENGAGVESVRLWGSLGNMDGKTKPGADNLQMNIWSDIWADPIEMYEEGYSLINMQNNHLYIIAGGGYDYLDNEEIFNNWEANRFYDNYNLKIVPAYSPKMLGASYMIWNDMSGSLDVGISEVDLFDRFFEPLGVISTKLWGENTVIDAPSYGEFISLYESIGCSPGSNPYALKQWEGEILRLTEEFGLEPAISLKGNSSYVETGYMGGNGNGYGIGGEYSISFEVYKQGNMDVAYEEQILFETDSAYAQTAFKAVQTGSGKVGFSREGRDYSFDYTLPEDEWVTLTIRGSQNQTGLYVNGKLVDMLGNAEPFDEYATFVFPLERIGSRTNSFCGMIRNIEIKAE